jgi:hypothetical protein
MARRSAAVESIDPETVTTLSTQPSNGSANTKASSIGHGYSVDSIVDSRARTTSKNRHQKHVRHHRHNVASTSSSSPSSKHMDKHDRPYHHKEDRSKTPDSHAPPHHHTSEFRAPLSLSSKHMDMHERPHNDHEDHIDASSNPEQRHDLRKKKWKRRAKVTAQYTLPILMLVGNILISVLA